jgi:hypothetical protein
MADPDAPASDIFDFGLPAELYVGHGSRRRTGLRYQSFDTAAEAIRHVVEQPHPAGEVATIESGDFRLGMKQIAELYNDPRYPLPRRRAASADPATEVDIEIKSIAIPVTRRMPAVRPIVAATATAPQTPVVRAMPASDQGPHPMPTGVARHRFKVGARLRMKQGGLSVARPASFCRVVFLLPYEGGQLFYRVKSEAESFERVVAEADLVPA